MPDRPKKARKRETGEKPKTTRVSKVGTRIRCSKCKGVGHNISSCDRRHGVASGPAAFTVSQSSAARNAAPSAAGPNPTASAGPNAMVSSHLVAFTLAICHISSLTNCMSLIGSCS